MTYNLVVHGGAGVWRRTRRERGIRGVVRAASCGQEILVRGGTALDAVEACVVAMEDNPVFNAGYGSALNLSGRVEMDASIMDGSTLQAGAVALVTRVRNPIKLARIVMERSDHVLVAGQGADHLAKVFRLDHRNPTTSYARKTWKLLRVQLAGGDLPHLARTSRLVREFPDLVSNGTVEAVARDRNGNIAAATSTGGLALRLPGRVGDTPLIGSGTYATKLGGCSVTGVAEGAIRLVLAKTACELMERGTSAQRAAERSVLLLRRKLGMTNGMIAVDGRGRIGSAHSTPDFCWAFAKSGMRGPRAAMKSQALARIREKA